MSDFQTAYSVGDINTLFKSILQHQADLNAVLTFAGSSATNQQIRLQIESSAEAHINVDPVIRLYQAAFGRLPDTAGLAANVATFIKGYDATALATSFLAGPEAAAIYGSASPAVTSGFVQAIYQNALNRTGSASELSYWVNSGKSAGQILAEIANSAESVSKAGVPILTFFDAQAASALNGDQASVTGSLYNQTTTNYNFYSDQNGLADKVVGSVNADTFLASGAFVNAIDTIDGGGGLDTLTITGAVQGTPGTVKNVEVINVVASGSNDIDFSKASGLQLLTLRNDGTGNDTISVKAGVLVGLDNVTGGYGETVTFAGTATYGSLAVANGTKAGIVALNNSGITTLNVVSTGSAGVTAKNVIGTLTSSGTDTTLNITGDRALEINGTDSSLTTIDASGNGQGVSVTAQTANANLKFIGGAGNDTLKIGPDTLVSTQSLDGGAGTDTLVIGNGSIDTPALTAALTAVKNFEVLGLSATAGLSIDVSKVGAFTTFETLSVTNLAPAATGTAATSTAANVVGKAGLAAAAFTNEVNGNTFIIDGDLTGQTGAIGSSGTSSTTGGAGGAALSLKPAFDGGSNVVSVTLNGVGLHGGNGGDANGSPSTTVTAGAGGSAIDASAFETVNIVSNFASGQTSGQNDLVGGTSNSDLNGHGIAVGANATVNITGAADINIADIYSGNGQSPNNNVIVNASTLTGKLDVTTGTGNDTIIGGSGGNTITLTGGLDTVNLTGSVAKADLVSVAGTHLPAGDSPSNVTTIYGFTNAAGTGDQLSFGAIASIATSTAAPATPSAAPGVYTNGSVSITAAVNSTGLVTFSNASGSATFTDYAGAAAGAGGVGKAVAFVYGGDTYVLVNDANAGYTAGTDQIVKLAGVTGVAGLSSTASDATHIWVH